MKKFIKIPVFATVFALALASCEEVIEIDLNTSDPKFVIEGTVSDQPEPFRVYIHKTVNFDSPNVYPAVSNAKVRIHDGSKMFDLTEISPGIYQTQNAETGEIGKIYHLKIEAEGQVFEAESQLFAPVPFDTLWQETSSSGPRERISIVPSYRDPHGVANHYRFVLWESGKALPNINVRDDRNSDGQPISQPIFLQNEDLAAGDTITVEMQAIDRPIYKYFYALNASMSNGPNASVPANPESNLSGGAMGYFSARTVSRKTLVIR